MTGSKTATLGVVRRQCVAWIAGMASLLLSTGAALADRPVAGSVTAERLKLPSGPNSVRGLADEPSVDSFNSQIGYQVPIDLPAGLGGLAPKLGLSYSGALGNGPLGIGWTLAQPRIQRSTRMGVPKFDDRDELELSGVVTGRLIAIGGDEFRVEGLGQTVRVRKVGSGFEVDDGTGVHYQFGVSAAARQESDATHTLAWLVETETNQMGELISYQYSRDQNQLYLREITWGPHGAYNVELAYEDRSDITRSYRQGFLVVTAHRLATVKVNAFGAERRAYHLAYEHAPAGESDATFPLARLSGVTSTGVAGRGDWPPLSFTYAAPATPLMTPIAGIGSWRLNSNGATLADVDGDGAADLLQLSSNGHSYRTNQNGSFVGLQSLTGSALPIESLQLQDVDGDSRPELLQDGGNGWSVWKFSKTKWVLQPGGVWPGSQGIALKQPETARFADLNGDGLVDAIRWSNDNLTVNLATRTGLSPAVVVPRIGGVALPTLDGRFQDTNGDGLDDYVLAGLDHLDVFIGRGDGTFDGPKSVSYPFAGSVSNPGEQLELADLDRDGLVDLLYIDSGTVRWFHGRADGTFRTPALTLANPEPLSSTVVVAIADTNGNGSQDVVWSSASGMWRMDLAGATTAGMLVRVQNGLGLDVAFDYQSSHALSAAARQSGTAWTSEVPIAMPVPVKKTTALGPGETTREVSYSVRDGFWDPVEQRFAGFLTTTVTTAGATLAQTSTVMTRYSKGIGADRELRGRPLVEQVFNGSGKRLSITFSDWRSMPVAELPDVPLLRSAVLRDVQTQYEDATPVRLVKVTHDYDTLGRVTHTVDSGRLDIIGDESVKDTTYADDDATWIRNRVCEEKVVDAKGVAVTDVQYLFGDDQATYEQCVVGKGWRRETRALLASEGRFVTQAQTSYDVHGNPISIVKNGVERRMVYDANGLFPLEEHLGGPDREIVWQATWDNVLGVVTDMTDPNGHVSRLSYDSLGRYIGAGIDGRAQHQVVEYDLTPPFPKTITWDYDGPLVDVSLKPPGWSATNHWRQTIEVANGKGELRYRALRLADAQWIISDYHEVDPNSRVVFAGRPVVSSQLELSVRPPGVVGDTLVYDPLGRLIEQALPNGAKRTYSYVAFERTMQDADLAPVHSVLDGRGRAIMTERFLSDGTHEIVEASYDPAGRLTQMTLSGGTVTRTFTYDTLGRLVKSQDPDLGSRTVVWDDSNRMLSETNAVGQAIRYGYDSLGRLSTLDNGSVYRYHYDAARPGAAGTLSNLVGQLAYVEEPVGGLELGYDELGRTAFTRRRIDDRVSESTTTYTASGLMLGRSYDDGFSLSYRYDPAGRMIGAGDLWSLLDQDACGMPLHETTQNGVDARYERDVLTLPSRVTLRDVSNTAIYDVRASRNVATEITAITDLDGLGLDHSATFGYDGFARLTSATVGSGEPGYTFGYSYDVLHNMKSRTAVGPHAIGSFVGTYRYGENNHAPRQLTSITDDAGNVMHTFIYDLAGRQTAEDQKSMMFDASDRLLRVDGLPGGSVTHVYGQDGMRVKTVEPNGTVLYLFGDGTSERNSLREHDVTVGPRVVARVAMTPGSSNGGVVGVGSTLRVTGTAWLLGLVAILFSLVAARPRARRRARAVGMAGLVFATSCSGPGINSRSQAITTPTVTYMHAGFAAGPTVFTDATGHLIEERRYEPFGVPVDAHTRSGGTDSIGAPDLVARDLNVLNKRVEATTGWSDHGARWMAPETGRWLTPDPLVIGPNARFMAAPWALHPYQYVNQNPVAYWDPDGRNSDIVADIWRSGMEEARAASASGPIGKAEAVAILGAAAMGAVLAGFAVMVKASADISPEMAMCGGDGECSAWMTMGRMWHDDIAQANRPIQSSDKSSDKKVPNPNGKKGGPEHQAKVDEVVKDVESRGLRAVKEHAVPTPGGEKGKRFVDVAGKDANGVVEMHQVGKQTQGGQPVARERRAINDIENATGQAPEFHPYNDVPPAQ